MVPAVIRIPCSSAHLSVNRHLHTGQAEELDAWCRQVAASLPVQLLKVGGVPKLRSAFLVYQSSMSRLQATRADLQSQLDSLLIRRQWRPLHEEGRRASEQGSCCSPSEGELSAASLDREDLQSVSSAPPETSQSAIVLGDSLAGLHEVLSKLQGQVRWGVGLGQKTIESWTVGACLGREHHCVVLLCCHSPRNSSSWRCARGACWAGLRPPKSPPP